MTQPTHNTDPYTGNEVARMFRVDSKTVARWDKAGKLPGAVFRTLGGHRRYRRDVIDELLRQVNND